MFTNLILFITIFISTFALDFKIKPELSIIPCNDYWTSNWETSDCVSSNSSYISLDNSNETCALIGKNQNVNKNWIAILDLIWTINVTDINSQGFSFWYSEKKNKNPLFSNPQIFDGVSVAMEVEYYHHYPRIIIYNYLGKKYPNYFQIYQMNFTRTTIFVKIAIIYTNNKLKTLIKVNSGNWNEHINKSNITLEDNYFGFTTKPNVSDTNYQITSLAIYSITQKNELNSLTNNQKILEMILDNIESEKAKCQNKLNNLNLEENVKHLTTIVFPDSETHTTLSYNPEKSVTWLLQNNTTSSTINNKSKEVVTEFLINTFLDNKLNISNNKSEEVTKRISFDLKQITIWVIFGLCIIIFLFFIFNFKNMTSHVSLIS